MGRTISPMREAKVAGSGPTAAPRLIVPMSLRLAIPRRVALQQSSPPLHQPGVILKQKEQLGKENPLNGKCASSQLSQPRGSPRKAVPPAGAIQQWDTLIALEEKKNRGLEHPRVRNQTKNPALEKHQGRGTRHQKARRARHPPPWCDRTARTCPL